MVNIIGDIAGQYDTLMALLAKMPDEEPISVGDMIDRGPDSKKVLEFFMKNGQAIFGNHEHFMVDALTGRNFYDPGTWLYNGGGATLKSFGCADIYDPQLEEIGPEIMSWLVDLPMSMKFFSKEGTIFVAHSFWPDGLTFDEATDIHRWTQRFSDPDNILWNREPPVRRDEFIVQIAGHNSQFGFERFKDDKGEFAICIDSSSYKTLTGIHLPSMEVFQQPFI